MFWQVVEKLRSTTKIAVTLACIVLAVGGATFAEDDLGPLTLSKVFVDHTFSALELQHAASPMSAFKSKNVTCPAKHTKGCTILVETSIEIWDVPSNGTMWEWVWASGSLVTIAIMEPTQGSTPSQRTFQYVITRGDAGTNVTIDVQLQNCIDTAYAGDRVETIELLLN